MPKPPYWLPWLGPLLAAVVGAAVQARGLRFLALAEVKINYGLSANEQVSSASIRKLFEDELAAQEGFSYGARGLGGLLGVGGEHAGG